MGKLIILGFLLMLIAALSFISSEEDDLCDDWTKSKFNNSFCKPLYNCHNGENVEERFNFVFEGVAFEDKNEFLDIIKNFMDLNSTDFNPGLMGREPFKSNTNLFNFWFINKINNCDDPTVDCGVVAKEFYNYCDLPHKYYFRFFDENSTPWSSDASGPWDWPFTPRPWGQLLEHNRGFLMHEFGHAFSSKNLEDVYAPLLLDEYGFSQWKYPNYDTLLKAANLSEKILPNIFFINKSTTLEDCRQNAPWKDLIGNGCGEEGIVDCILEYEPPEIEPIHYENITCKPEFGLEFRKLDN